MGLWGTFQIKTVAVGFYSGMVYQKPYFDLGLGKLVEGNNKTGTNTLEHVLVSVSGW
jgi:hypothetical protein